MNEGRGKKGILLVSILGVSVLVVLGAGGLLLGAGGPQPRERSDPSQLTSAKSAVAEEDFARAEELLREGLKADPGNRDLNLQLAKVLLERGRLGAARELFEKLLKAVPEDVAALVGMARCLDRLGQQEMALVHFKRALGIRKNDPRILRELGLMEHRSGNWAAALVSLEMSHKIDPAQEDVFQIMSEIANRPPTRGNPTENPSVPGIGRPSPFGSMDPRGPGQNYDPMNVPGIPGRAGGRRLR